MAGRGEVQKRGFDLAPAQALRKPNDPFNTRLRVIKGPVNEVKKGFSVEIGNTRGIRPYDTPTRPVPQPCGIGQVTQIFKRWRLIPAQNTRGQILPGRSPRNYELMPQSKSIFSDCVHHWLTKARKNVQMVNRKHQKHTVCCNARFMLQRTIFVSI